MRTPNLALSALALLAACSSSSGPTAACGGQGQPCCNAVTCDTGLACLSATCVDVGGTVSGSGHSVTTTSGSGRATASASSGAASATGAATTGGASGTGSSGGSTTSGGAPTDGDGTPCAKNSDCPSGICLPVGGPKSDGRTGDVCASVCTSAASCVAGWSCGPLAGQSGEVCQCSYASEICDGKDNDCNGIVDDEPQVDQACASQLGAGAVCAGGSCACGASVSTCAGKCVDVQTDSENCGGCGQACTIAGMACVQGSCRCTGNDVECSDSCVDTQTDLKNCGSCGNVCPDGPAAVCSGGSCSACVSAGSTCTSDSVCCSGAGECAAWGSGSETTCGAGTLGDACVSEIDCFDGTCQNNVCCVPDATNLHCSQDSDCCSGDCYDDPTWGMICGG